MLERNEEATIREGLAGMVHTGYWSAIMQRNLLTMNEKTQPHATDYNCNNGAHYFEFKDHVTAKRYSVRIKPLED